MNIIDAILNVALVLLWLNATVRQWTLSGPQTARSLLRTLERTEVPTPRRWVSLIGFTAVVFFRAVFYWQIGSAVGWTPAIDLGAFSISFRSDHFSRMLLYSLLCISKWLLVLYVGIVFLVLLTRTVGAGDSLHRFILHQLGILGRFSPWVAAGATVFSAMVIWAAVVYPLSRLGIFPSPRGIGMVMAQGVMLSLGIWLKMRWVIWGILLLYILSTYVYFGSHPFWFYVAMVGRQLVRPLSGLPLRLGKVDFAPLVMAVIIFVIFHLGDRVVAVLFDRIESV